MVIKDRILGKAWEAQFVMLVAGRNLGEIHEKLSTQESALGGGRFFAFGLTVVGKWHLSL
jgi:hypothetical protein